MNSDNLDKIKYNAMNNTNCTAAEKQNLIK
jgi:hypothetical protein